MRRSAVHLISPFLLISLVLSSCSRDPNVRKQKYFQSGQEYFEKGKFAEATIQFANALRIDPKYAEAHYQLSQCYLKTQRFSRAFQELAITISLQPDHYGAHTDIANALIVANNFPEAQQETGLLLQKWPNDPQSHITASSLFAAQGKFPKAIDEMQKAIELNPSRWESYLGLALLQVKNNQGIEAESNFRKAAALSPKATDPLIMLGSYYQSTGRLNEAEQQFRTAISTDPKNPALYGFLAKLYLSEGKKEQAETLLSDAKLNFPADSVGYRMLGDFYSATGDLGRATDEYTRLYQQHSKDIQVKKNYVQLLILSNRLEEATKLIDEILKSNPNDNDGQLYRCEIQIRQGHYTDAIPTLQTLTTNDPANSLAHYYLGAAFERSGDLEGAQREWQQAVRIRPEMVEAQHGLAGIAIRKNDMAALEQAATAIISSQPSSPDGYALRAISNINRRHLADAEADVQKSVAVSPQSPVGYVEMGSLRLVQKKYQDAEAAYQQALDRNPNSSDALRGLINTELAQGHIDAALAAANRQIILAPKNSDFYDLQGTILFRNKKALNDAEAAFTKALELDKNNSDAVIKLGEVFAANGKPDQAILTYQQAIKDHPQQVSFYLLLGQLYEAKKDWNQAQDYYQHALALKSADPLASKNLANVMLQNGGNFDVALSLAQTARRAMPESADAADTLGWVYYHKAAYELAIGSFKEALRLSEKNRISDDPKIHYHLGLAYQKSNQSALARQQLERVLKISPDFPDAGEVRKQLAQLKS